MDSDLSREKLIIDKDEEKDLIDELYDRYFANELKQRQPSRQLREKSSNPSRHSRPKRSLRSSLRLDGKKYVIFMAECIVFSFVISLFMFYFFAKF